MSLFGLQNDKPQVSLLFLYRRGHNTGCFRLGYTFRARQVVIGSRMYVALRCQALNSTFTSITFYPHHAPGNLSNSCCDLSWSCVCRADLARSEAVPRVVLHLLRGIDVPGCQGEIRKVRTHTIDRVKNFESLVSEDSCSSLP